MTRLHCPYCAPAPAFHRTTEHGIPICGYCGDPLIRIQRFKLRQLAAAVAVSALVAPLVALVWLSLQNPQEPRPPQPQDRVAKTWVADIHAPVAS